MFCVYICRVKLSFFSSSFSLIIIKIVGWVLFVVFSIFLLFSFQFKVDVYIPESKKDWEGGWICVVVVVVVAVVVNKLKKPLHSSMWECDRYNNVAIYMYLKYLLACIFFFSRSAFIRSLINSEILVRHKNIKLCTQER